MLVLVWVFLSLLKLSKSSVSISAIAFVAIAHTFAFHCTVRAPALDRLHVGASTYQTSLTLERSLWTLERKPLFRSIAPLLRSSA